MKKLVLTITFLASFFSNAQDYSKIKIYSDSEGLQRLAELGVPVDHGERKKNTFLISDFSAEQIETIRENGFSYEVLIPDVKKFYREQYLNESGDVKNASCSTTGVGNVLPSVPVNFETTPSSYAGMYRYQEMLDALDDMASMYPNLISVKTAISTFQTWEGRPIYHVKISDNPSLNESSETKVLYTAIHHAREPLSMSQTIFYMWYLLENYDTNDEIAFLVDNTEMYFVPCLNPDGYLENESSDPNGGGMWRKNRRDHPSSNSFGVDLNRNYSYGWGTTGISFNLNSDVYPGTGAFSEPETQAIQWLVENVGFTSAFNAHSYGDLFLHPIGTTDAEFAAHHDYFTEYGGHMAAKNGYFVQKSSGLYPASGDSDDYMYKVDNGVGAKDTIFAMTPEVGGSFWPSPSQVTSTCQDMLHPNLVLSHITHKYMPVVDADPGSISTMSGNFNHNVQRLGLVDGAVTVSIDALQNIQTVGPGVVHDLNIKQTASGSIAFTLNPLIQFGDEVKYILKTEYGTWTKRDTITKTFGSLPVQFSDNASSTTNWTGDWNMTNAYFVSPSTSFTDGSGDYQDNTTQVYELLQSIDLTNTLAAQISFYARWEIESNYDYCQFQVSTDNGSSWIGQCGNYTMSGTSANGSVQPDNEPVFEGVQTSWVLEEISLSDYIGQVIKVRFILESDGGVTEDGFYFDDFAVSYSADEAGLVENNIRLKVFPNPSNSAVVISTSKVISNGQVVVYDQSGKLIYDEKITEQTNSISVNTSRLPQGFYTVQVLSENRTSTPVKLVVIH